MWTKEKASAHNKEWMKKNKEKRKAYMKEWMALNRERYNARMKKYHRDHPEKWKAYYLKNREHLRMKGKKWYRENKELVDKKYKDYYEKNKSDMQQRAIKWQKDNPHKANANCRARFARKLHATPSWANDFFIKEIYHLAALRTKIMGFKWHVDHIVPLQSKTVCGLHVEHNLQVIPATQNLSKHNTYWPEMP